MRIVWLGREDSNLRMAESKSAALPLGYAPFPGGLLAPQRRADHSGRAVGDQRHWSEAHLPLTDAWSELD